MRALRGGEFAFVRLVAGAWLVTATGVLAGCGEDSREAALPGATPASSAAMDTIEGLLRVRPERMTLQRCSSSTETRVAAATGTDLREAAIELGATADQPIHARLLGEWWTAADSSGPGSTERIRVAAWVYLAEDVSGCPGQEPSVVDSAGD